MASNSPLMQSARQILEAFCEIADGRCAFDLRNGAHLEGYLIEVGDIDVEFGHGGPLAPDENELIQIDEIDLATLYFWSESERCYLHALWDEERSEWQLTPDKSATTHEPATSKTLPHEESRTSASSWRDWFKRAK